MDPLMETYQPCAFCIPSTILHHHTHHLSDIFFQINVFKGEAYRRGVFSSATRGVSLEALRRRLPCEVLPCKQFADEQNSSGSEVSRSARLAPPRYASTRLATPSYAFPSLNVQLAKRPTASGVFLPPRADAHSNGRKGMPLKTLFQITL
ncbi:unnamed protein product [Prunus armeniaca]